MKLTTQAKNSIISCFQHVAFVDDQGPNYIQALRDALYTVDSIAAVYTQSGTVYSTTPLDDLKADLVVTATYEGGDTQIIPGTDYTLSGTLAVGTSTVTVTYIDKSTSFTVSVSAGGVSDMDEWTDGIRYTDLEVVANSYVNMNGVIQSYNGWSRTGYVFCNECGSLTFSGNTASSEYNVFFDANKAKVEAFTVPSGTTTIKVPTSAAYFMLSNTTSGLNTELLSITPHKPEWQDGVAYTDIRVVSGSYVRHADGTFQNYSGWSRTDFVYCEGASTITFPPLQQEGTGSIQSTAFYSANSTADFISSFELSRTQSTTVTVPATAKYFAISSNSAALTACLAAGIVPHE